MQRYHLSTRGTMSGSFKPCHARHCRKQVMHLDEYELEAARMWMQDRSPQALVHSYQVGQHQALKALADPNYGELLTAARLLASAEPEPMVYSRRSLFQRVGDLVR